MSFVSAPGAGVGTHVLCIRPVSGVRGVGVSGGVGTGVVGGCVSWGLCPPDVVGNLLDPGNPHPSYTYRCLVRISIISSCELIAPIGTAITH